MNEIQEKYSRKISLILSLFLFSRVFSRFFLLNKFPCCFLYSFDFLLVFAFLYHISYITFIWAINVLQWFIFLSNKISIFSNLQLKPSTTGNEFQAFLIVFISSSSSSIFLVAVSFIFVLGYVRELPQAIQLWEYHGRWIPFQWRW